MRNCYFILFNYVHVNVRISTIFIFLNVRGGGGVRLPLNVQKFGIHGSEDISFPI